MAAVTGLRSIDNSDGETPANSRLDGMACGALHPAAPGMAKCAERFGDADLAIKHFEDSFKEIPNYLSAVSLAELLIEKKDYDRAEHYLGLATGMGGDEPFIRHLMMRLPRGRR